MPPPQVPQQRPGQQPPAEHRTQAPEHAPQDSAPQTRTPQERAPQEQAPHEKAPQDKTQQDSAPQEREPQENAPQERAPDEQPPHDDVPEPRHEQNPASQDDAYLRDPKFHTEDPADFHRLTESQLDVDFAHSKTGELRHEWSLRRALELRDQVPTEPGQPDYRHMSDQGAYAVHSYTKFELVSQLTAAQRLGGDALADLSGQARAITSGLNELGNHEGPVSRRVGFAGNESAILGFLRAYREGTLVVDPQFLSFAKATADNPGSPFPGEVELRVTSKTGKDISGIASRPGEREVLFKAETPMMVERVELGRAHPEHPDHANAQPSDPKWIIHAEEVAPGDPRHPGTDEVRRLAEERRAYNVAEHERIAEENRQPKRDILGTTFADGREPELIEQTADAPVETGPDPKLREPEGGWSTLAEPLTPGGEPVIHADRTQSPNQQARLLLEVAPGLEQVNTRNFYHPDALENGHQTNSAESLVAFEDRMTGGDGVAEAARPGRPPSLEQVSERLGGQWADRPDLDSVARELGQRPVGARAGVAFEAHVPADPDAPAGSPESKARVETRLVAAIKTEHGIVFADPMSGRLAELPAHAEHIKTLPLGGGDAPVTHYAGDEPGLVGRRLDGPPEVPRHFDENYLFDSEHRATDAEHQSIRDAAGNQKTYDQIRHDALQLRDADPALRGMSDEGATAVHGYTRSEYAYDVNAAGRLGEGHPGYAQAHDNTRAIVSGLNEVPDHVGDVVRGIDFRGDPRLAELAAGHYEPGRIVVETTLTSATIKTADSGTSKFGDDVEIHLQSKTGKDISGLAMNPGERESLSRPGTQLLVHSRELVVDPTTKRGRWVIHAEEIAPGDPRYLSPEQAKQKMDERRARHVAEQPVFEERARERMRELLGDNSQPDAPPAETPSISKALDGDEPQVGDLPQTDGPPDWSSLAQPTNPPSEPAIHASTATPEQQAAYIRAQHPQLSEVNPHYNDPDALANGYRSNCTRGPEAYWDRLHGGDGTAEPLLMHEMDARGTLEHIEGRFGGEFSDRADYDSVIREMRDRPVDHHAVVAVKYVDALGTERGHVAMVVNTREGVAFIDPQSGALMHLPQPPSSLRVLHVGVPDPDGTHPGLSHTETSGEAHHGGYGSADSYLNRPEVATALDGLTGDMKLTDADGVEHNLGPTSDFIRTRLPEHPELVRLMEDPANAYLTQSLLGNPQTLASLLAHEDAIPILEDAVNEVNTRGYEILDEFENDGGPEPTPLTDDQREISANVREDTAEFEAGDRQQPGFDHTRQSDPAYQRQFLDEQNKLWPKTQQELNTIADRLAAENDGHAGYRTEQKKVPRSLQKIEEYEGDVSKLTDLVGAKVEFKTVADAYAALEKVREDPSVEIVKFKDRFAKPQDSGYRDLQMNVRMSNGHIAEFRLHLAQIDEVSAYEHSLYEVRRDLEAGAEAEGKRRMTPEERLLEAALLQREQALFWEALQKGLPRADS